MNALHQWIERMWWQPSTPPLLLRAMEPVYAAISRCQLERRAGQQKQPQLPLISVGNITAGGSGKTPFVIWLAAQLLHSGYTPVILCRGDSGKASSEPVLVHPDADPAVVGDEALLLAQTSGCKVISGRDRIRGSEMAAALGNIMIIDDGFQYRSLGRACDIVLIPSDGVGNGHQIPAGPLREPINALARADLIVRTGAAHCSSLTAEKEWHWQAIADDLMDIMHTGSNKPDAVFAATGIARPQRFFDDLKTKGLTLAGTRIYPDHHRFTKQDVSALTTLKQPIAVTAKDAVKLAKLWPTGTALWVLPQRGHGEAGLFEATISHITR